MVGRNLEGLYCFCLEEGGSDKIGMVISGTLLDFHNFEIVPSPKTIFYDI